MRKEARGETSIEAAQQTIFHQVKKLAEDEIGLNGGFCLDGEAHARICTAFKINMPDEVELLFGNPIFSGRYNAEEIAQLKEPIELKRIMENTVALLYQIETENMSER